MKKEPQPPDNVIELFAMPETRSVPPLCDDEIILLRKFIREFAIIRATCPLAVRALSARD
jgi:hypothetical protein